MFSHCSKLGRFVKLPGIFSLFAAWQSDNLKRGDDKEQIKEKKENISPGKKGKKRTNNSLKN
jgi:hypothetical protein